MTGKELRTKLADEWYFRFGGNVRGKAIESLPEGLGNGVAADKVSSVMGTSTSRSSRRPSTGTGA